MAGVGHYSGCIGAFEPVNIFDNESDERFFGNIPKNRSFFVASYILAGILARCRFDFPGKKGYNRRRNSPMGNARMSFVKK